jgi:choline kinase
MSGNLPVGGAKYSVDQAPPVSTALLLAAGAGTRLNFGAEAEATPKCLVEVGGVSILERLVSNLGAHGIRRLVIVTGYMEKRIRDVVSQITGDIEIETINNPDYATTNNIYSLWLAREQVRESFLLVESDLVFERDLLRGMLTPDKAAVSKILPWMNGTTVGLDSQQKVESFDLTGLLSIQNRYKTVNLYCLSLDRWNSIISRLEEHISTGRTGSYYEVVFAEMVDENDLKFEAVVFPSDRWYEIDTYSDREAASQLLTSWPLINSADKEMLAN